MATTNESLSAALDRLKGVEGIAYRKMMGEYLLYKDGVLFGGVYDNRLLIKPVKSAVALIENAVFELPYNGAKPMLLADEAMDAEKLKAIVEAAAAELAKK